MRSFLRHKKQRSTRLSSQPITNNNNTNDTTTIDASSNSTTSTSSHASTNGTGIGASSILTLLAIQASDIREMVVYHNPRALLLLTNSNAYYHQSVIGTLGPCTYMILLLITSIYVGLAWKGERNQSRSRLEVCTAITTSVSASCKPECSSSAFAEEPTPPYPMMCSKQITFIMLLPVASRQLVMTYSYQHTNQ